MLSALTLVEVFIASAAGVTVAVLIALSMRWTEKRTHGVLQRSLKRPLKAGEEDSLGAWLKVPQRDLDTLSRELDENPFTEVIDQIERRGKPDTSI